MPGRPDHKCCIALIGQGRCKQNEKALVQPEMCIPISPTTEPPKLREALRPEPPFPFLDCYQWTYATVHVRLPTKLYDHTHAIALPPQDAVAALHYINQDRVTRSLLRRARDGRPSPVRPGPPHMLSSNEVEQLQEQGLGLGSVPKPLDESSSKQPVVIRGGQAAEVTHTHAHEDTISRKSHGFASASQTLHCGDPVASASDFVVAVGETQSHPLDRDENAQGENVIQPQDASSPPSPLDLAAVPPSSPKPISTCSVVGDQGRDGVHTPVTPDHLTIPQAAEEHTGTIPEVNDDTLSAVQSSRRSEHDSYGRTPPTPDQDDIASLVAKDSLARMFLGDPYEDRTEFVLVNVSLDLSEVSEVNDPMGFLEEEEALSQ